MQRVAVIEDAGVKTAVEGALWIWLSQNAQKRS